MGHCPVCRADWNVERQKKNVKLTAGIAMRPDFFFECFKCDHIEYHEYKGFETAIYKLKKKLWKEHGPAKLYVWKGTGKNLKIVETLTPLSMRKE